ncbi:hypothetical protein NEOLI_002589 [Neolecta irregularis DAH-3]|uniref:Uncharacterized protein n=1 Tax=Neolecta irregularis (strain DAH-3) TaxID=1198029 RepID=A0A1U7LIQ8_NEOID|nr:hypothetical protein NEOLI_002589 [Neolecta irregularis DAH-3]|eukprot:OLL22529.1 hypothetical protein NEOLI_002589 [Neolecta irregularis DAH-3]
MRFQPLAIMVTSAITVSSSPLPTATPSRLSFDINVPVRILSSEGGILTGASIKQVDQKNGLRQLVFSAPDNKIHSPGLDENVYSRGPSLVDDLLSFLSSLTNSLTDILEELTESREDMRSDIERLAQGASSEVLSGRLDEAIAALMYTLSRMGTF